VRLLSYCVAQACKFIEALHYYTPHCIIITRHSPNGGLVSGISFPWEKRCSGLVNAESAALINDGSLQGKGIRRRYADRHSRQIGTPDVRAMIQVTCKWHAGSHMSDKAARDGDWIGCDFVHVCSTSGY